MTYKDANDKAKDEARNLGGVDSFLAGSVFLGRVEAIGGVGDDEEHLEFTIPGTEGTIRVPAYKVSVATRRKSQSGLISAYPTLSSGAYREIEAELQSFSDTRREFVTESRQRIVLRATSFQVGDVLLLASPVGDPEVLTYILAGVTPTAGLFTLPTPAVFLEFEPVNIQGYVGEALRDVEFPNVISEEGVQTTNLGGFIPENFGLEQEVEPRGEIFGVTGGIERLVVKGTPDTTLRRTTFQYQVVNEENEIVLSAGYDVAIGFRIPAFGDEHTFAYNQNQLPETTTLPEPENVDMLSGVTYSVSASQGISFNTATRELRINNNTPVGTTTLRYVIRDGNGVEESREFYVLINRPS